MISLEGAPKSAGCKGGWKVKREFRSLGEWKQTAEEAGFTVEFPENGYSMDTRRAVSDMPDC